MKSGKLNFLEPCGPLQACNWTALPCFSYPLPEQCRCRTSRSPCMLNLHFHNGYRRFIFSVKGRCQYIKLHEIIMAPKSGIHRQAPVCRTKLPTLSHMSSSLGISTLTWLKFFSHTTVSIVFRNFDSLLKVLFSSVSWD